MARRMSNFSETPRKDEFPVKKADLNARFFKLRKLKFRSKYVACNQYSNSPTLTLRKRPITMSKGRATKFKKFVNTSLDGWLGTSKKPLQNRAKI
jgi:hypothetical protein